MDSDQRAAWANRLRGNEDFQQLLEEFRSEAVARFENSARGKPEEREEAHAMLRAVTELEGILTQAVNEIAFESRKGQHRGHD